MRALPLAARLYLIAVWGAAAMLVGFTLLGSRALFEQAPLLLLWLALFALADYFEVGFEVGNGEQALMTVYEAAQIFLVAVAGSPGVLVMLFGTVIVDTLHRRPWYRICFNAAERIITYVAMLGVYRLLQAPGVSPFSGLRGLLALGATAATYYTLNTLLVATIIALATRQPLLQVYRDSYLTVHWVHFVTLPLGAVLAALWYIDPWLLLPGVIPLVMAHRSFKALAAGQAESRRSQSLAREARELAGKLERLQDATTAMIASLEPIPLLQTVSSRLAALLGASASWVILLDQSRASMVAAAGTPPSLDWDAPAYAAQMRQGLRVVEHADIDRLHPQRDSRWQALVIIPLALSTHVRGGICLALERPIVLAEDDQRVLLAFAAQAALAMEHARLFEELRHKQDELVRSSKLAALGTFSAGIAHEFNNLLAGIVGFAELGLSSDDVADKNEALDVAIRASMRGRSITSGLLTFARRGEAQRGLHMLQEAVEEVLMLVERELAKSNIRIQRQLRPVAPTICDPGQLAQVVLNLITNARDAMLDRGGGVITVALSEQDGQIELVVSDTGSGIPEHLLDQVFQPFMTTKGALGGSATPGTGLGLAISYGIIQSHSGTIQLASQVGVGTTVTVRLPIVGDTVADTSKPIASRDVLAQRILVVDDEPLIAESIARLLAGQGHHVVSATDGATALRYYREQLFDLVISDIVMPGMDGVKFIGGLRAIAPDARVLIMTGHVAQPHVEQLLRDGALGVIKKPFVAEDLLAAVARCAETRSLRAA